MTTASHDSDLYPASAYPTARWAASTYAFVALTLSVAAMLLGMKWANQLGLGVPLFVSGAVAFFYRAAVGNGEKRAIGAVSLAVVASSLWTTIAVTTSGGSPSVVVWGARVALLAALVYPIVRPGKTPVQRA